MALTVYIVDLGVPCMVAKPTKSREGSNYFLYEVIPYSPDCSDITGF